MTPHPAVPAAPGPDRRTALVTGAAGGIGAAVARTLAQRGTAVALFDLPGPRLDHTVGELRGDGAAAIGTPGDVTRPADIEAAVTAAGDAFGSVDVLVTCAGIGGGNAAVAELTDDAWDRVLRVNLDGVFYCCRAVVPHMVAAGWGRIVTIASIAGLEGNPNAAHYSASKAGVIALTKALGKELATTGVLVNAVAPAVIETELLAQVTPQQLDYMRAKIPMGRFGTPEEVAALVAFLASDEVSFSTGAVYDLSGGRAVY